MEMTEGASKTTSTRLLRKNAASLVLTRWLMSKRSLIKQNDGENEKDHAQYESPLPDSPSILEDYSVYTSERIRELDRTSLRINEDFIRSILTEHMRRVGVRPHLWEDLTLDGTDEAKIKGLLAACKLNEINALMLYAGFMNRTDLIHNLCKYGANVDYAEPEHGLTAIHLCAFRNSLDGVQYLISQGATVDTQSKYTPFHYAAFGDAFNVAHYFIQQSINQESSESEETVLHVAARTNALRVLSLLATHNNQFDQLDQDGYAAIHHAADGGDPGCLKILLKAGSQVDLLTGNNSTALHLAAAAGCAENITLLIANNANVHLKDHRGYTALHLAARSHSLECAEILLKGGSNPNAEDKEGRAPLHLALGRSLLTDDIAELLVTWRANVNKADKYGYTPLHTAASNELSQCVNLLIRREADLSARTKGGTSALSIVLRKTPTSLDIFEQRLDEAMTLHRQGCVAGEIELRFDFRPLLQHRRQCEIGYLDTFVKEGYKEILEHPLCQSFLHLKWQKIRKYYVARLLFYLVYVLILTSWVMIAVAHKCYNESDKHRHNSSLCTSEIEMYWFFHERPMILEVQWYVLAVLTILEAFRKFAVIPSYISIKRFFAQIENLIEWCVILSVFATSFIYTGETYDWQSYLGAFAVLCGWGNLMIMIGQLPVLGTYVAMFTSVQAQVLKLLLAYVWLLIGFTASFCVIFPQSKSFRSPHTGLLKVLVMMTGELTFEELYFSSHNATNRKDLPNEHGSSSILLQISTQFFFIFFVLFVTIVLMNLLIGIAVHDIKGLQKTAGLAKLVRQSKLIYDMEIALFLGLLPKRLIKYLRWTTLLLPSSVRAALTVRPLNPRETRLPRDVLSAAYKIAKEGDGHNVASSRKRSEYRGKSYYAKACLRDDAHSTAFLRHRPFDEDALVQNYNKFKDDIAELRKICEENQTLLQNLVKKHTVTE